MATPYRRKCSGIEANQIKKSGDQIYTKTHTLKARCRAPVDLNSRLNLLTFDQTSVVLSPSSLNVPTITLLEDFEKGA
jgi:hypothetical protein